MAKMSVTSIFLRLIVLMTVSSVLISACAAQLDPAPAGQQASTPVPTATAASVASAPMATAVPEGMPTAVDALASASPTIVPAQASKTLQELGYPVSAYSDPVGGLAFDYPTGWTLTDLSAEQKQNALIYTITLRSMQVTPTPKQQEGLPQGMTAIDIGVNKNGPKTLPQAVDERRAAAAAPDSGAPAKITVDEDWTLRGGLPAHRLVMTAGSGQQVFEVITMIQGHMVLVSGQGDPALFDAIAASLRATN